MAKGINKVILVGNLGNDPEVHTFPDGGTVANISLATSDSYKDKQTGQQVDKTEWHRVVLRDRGNYKLGHIASQYLKKGSKVYIEGSLQTRKYSDNQGIERYVTEIIAFDLQMLDSKQDGQQAQQYQQQAPQVQVQQRPAQPQQQTAANGAYNGVPHAAQYQVGQAQPAQSFNDIDYDVPF